MVFIEIINISHGPYNCTLVIIIRLPKHLILMKVCLSYPNYKLYEEYNDWVESGTPPKGAGPFSGSSETPQIPGLMQSLSMSTPSSRDAVHAAKSPPMFILTPS